MVRINLNAPDASLVPGTDLWKIHRAEETRSKASGAAMIIVTFSRVSNIADEVRDNIMLEGKGWNMGKQKLAALVGEGFEGDLNLLDLIGKRFWLATKIESYNGNDSLKVDIKQLKYLGMQPEADIPAGCSAAEPDDSDEPPF